MKCLCLFELQLYPRVVHVNLIDVSYSCKFIFMLFEQAELRNYGWLVIMVFIIYIFKRFGGIHAGQKNLHELSLKIVPASRSGR